MARYRYVQDAEGNVKSVLVKDRLPMRGTPDCLTMGFHEMVLNAYKESEGSGKFRDPEFSATQIKDIHKHAIARGGSPV